MLQDEELPAVPPFDLIVRESSPHVLLVVPGHSLQHPSSNSGNETHVVDVLDPAHRSVRFPARGRQVSQAIVLSAAHSFGERLRATEELDASLRQRVAEVLINPEGQFPFDNLTYASCHRPTLMLILGGLLDELGLSGTPETDAVAEAVWAFVLSVSRPPVDYPKTSEKE